MPSVLRTELGETVAQHVVVAVRSVEGLGRREVYWETEGDGIGRAVVCQEISYVNTDVVAIDLGVKSFFLE